MLGDLMGNMQEKQEELKKNLSSIAITSNLEGIQICGNAGKEITEITIGDDYMSSDKKEELEELLSVAVNNFITKASEEEAKASENLIKDLLPGMGGMFGL